jgi:hypothetical protein
MALSPFTFSASAALSEIEALDDLLDTREDLGERETLLPFFQSHQHVAAALGYLFGKITTPDRIGFEYRILGDFRADIVIGDSAEGAFVLVELENAAANSIFYAGDRSVSHWSSRFYEGFSQLVDWSYALDQKSSSTHLRLELGNALPDLLPMLVIGRRSMLSEKEENRLRWYRQNVPIRGNEVFVLTFDDVARRLRTKLTTESN